MDEGKTGRLGRDAMRDHIVAAAGELLARDGSAGFGVNAVARAAGCDKQLIYRYFGGLAGLVEAIGQTLAQRIASRLPRPLAAPATYGQLVESLLLGLLDLYRADGLLRGIAAWEMTGPTDLVAPLGEARSAGLARWVGEMRGRLEPPQGVDVAAVNALLIGGVQQLALAEAGGRDLAGLPSDDAGLARARRALKAMVRAVYP